MSGGDADAGRDAIVAALEGFPARLAATVAAAASKPVPAGEWGSKEVIRHLIACETDVHQARLADLTTHQAPEWGWAEPGPWSGEPDLRLDQLLDRFAALRAATLDTVGALDDVGWVRAGTHQILGTLDVHGLLASAVAHDAEHLEGLR